MINYMLNGKDAIIRLIAGWVNTFQNNILEEQM